MTGVQTCALPICRSPVVAVLTLVVTLLLAASNAGAGSVSQPKLAVRIIGPTSVVPETNNAYMLVLTNTGNAAFGMVKLHFSPAEVMTHSSLPCLKYVGFYKPHTTCSWTIRNFKPGAKYQVKLALNFPTTDSAGNIVKKFSSIGEAKGVSPGAMTYKYFTVSYTSSPTG